MEINICIAGEDGEVDDFDMPIEHVETFMNLLKQFGFHDLDTDAQYRFAYAEFSAHNRMWIQMEKVDA